MENFKGILLSGYSLNEKDIIIENIKNELKLSNLLVYSGYSKNQTIKEILIEQNLDKFDFKESDKKILMFLNFSDNEIKKVLSIFPKNIKRPFFCVLTITNQNWSIDKLYNDLKLENEEIKKRINAKKNNK